MSQRPPKGLTQLLRTIGAAACLTGRIDRDVYITAQSCHHVCVFSVTIIGGMLDRAVWLAWIDDGPRRLLWREYAEHKYALTCYT